MTKSTAVPSRAKRNVAALAALAVIAGISGCSTNTGSHGNSVVATAYRAENSTGALYKGARSSGKLDAISAKLAAVAGIKPVEVFVVNANVPNAILGSDGKIYVTRNLVQLTADDSELAAVIAHELGHQIAGHPAQRSKAGTMAGVSSADIATMLSEGGSADVTALLARKTERVASLSRKQELEADAIAIRLLAKAGYDPKAVSRFLKVMQSETPAPGGQAYISYHPAPTMRIERADSLAASL